MGYSLEVSSSLFVPTTFKWVLRQSSAEHRLNIFSVLRRPSLKYFSWVANYEESGCGTLYIYNVYKPSSQHRANHNRPSIMAHPAFFAPIERLLGPGTPGL